MAERRKKGQGSVRVLPNGKADYRFIDPTGKRVERRADSEAEAYRLLNKALVEIGEGDYIAPSDSTLSGWIEKWLRLYKQNKLKESTYFNYWHVYKLYIKPHKLGSMCLDDIRQDHIQDFINSMARSYSKATVKYTYTVLSSSLEKAANPSIALIRRNPAKGIEWPKFKTPKKKARKLVLSADEQRKLEAVLPGRYLSDMILLMLNTGLRPGEAMGLQWKDVDLKKGIIRVTGNRMRIGILDEDMNHAGYEVKDQDSPKSAAGNRSIPMNL